MGHAHFRSIWCCWCSCARTTTPQSYIYTLRGSWVIFGDSWVTLAQWWRARHLNPLAIRSSPVRFRPKTRQLRFTWIWANRPSSKSSKLLFAVIKAIWIKFKSIHTYMYICIFEYKFFARGVRCGMFFSLRHWWWLYYSCTHLSLSTARLGWLLR